MHTSESVDASVCTLHACVCMQPDTTHPLGVSGSAEGLQATVWIFCGTAVTTMLPLELELERIKGVGGGWR